MSFNTSVSNMTESLLNGTQSLLNQTLQCNEIANTLPATSEEKSSYTAAQALVAAGALAATYGAYHYGPKLKALISNAPGVVCDLYNKARGRPDRAEVARIAEAEVARIHEGNLARFAGLTIYSPLAKFPSLEEKSLQKKIHFPEPFFTIGNPSSVGAPLQMLRQDTVKQQLPKSIGKRCCEQHLFPNGGVNGAYIANKDKLSTEKVDALLEIGRVLRKAALTESDLTNLKTNLQNLAKGGLPTEAVNGRKINELCLLLELFDMLSHGNTITAPQITQFYATLRRLDSNMFPEDINLCRPYDVLKTVQDLVEEHLDPKSRTLYLTATQNVVQIDKSIKNAPDYVVFGVDKAKGSNGPVQLRNDAIRFTDGTQKYKCVGYLSWAVRDQIKRDGTRSQAGHATVTKISGHHWDTTSPGDQTSVILPKDLKNYNLPQEDDVHLIFAVKDSGDNTSCVIS